MNYEICEPDGSLYWKLFSDGHIEFTPLRWREVSTAFNMSGMIMHPSETGSHLLSDLPGS